MNLARNIVGVLATVAVILSGTLLGMPKEAHAALDVPQSHAYGSQGTAHASHQMVHHGDHVHHHPGHEVPDEVDHSDHGQCNAMACCPIVSLGTAGPKPFFLADSICHRPYEGPSLVQAAPERADKPPKHS